MLKVDNYDEILSRDQLVNELVDMYGSDLKRIAYLYIRDESQCEDIIQEVFLASYRHIDNFRNESNYKTWLTRITINKCRDYQRKWNFKNFVYKPFLEPIINKDNSKKLVEDKFEEIEESNVIINAISQLAPKFKEVIILYYYQDLTIKEISEVTKINFNTVKSRLARGKVYLRTELERRGINYGRV